MRIVPFLLPLALAASPPARAQSVPVEDLAPVVVGFDAAVRQALARNPSVSIAAQEVARAEALVRQTRSASLPTLIANGSFTQLDGDRVQGGVRVLAASELAASVTLGVPLVEPTHWAQWSQARENVNLARLGADEVRRQLAASVARIYLTLVAQHRLIDVARTALVAAEAHYQFAHQRFAGGLGTRVDDVRAAQEAASDRAQVESAYAQLSRLRETLGVLLGSDRAVDVETEIALAAPPTPSDALAGATTQRADVKLLAGRQALAHHVRRDSWTDYLPTLVALIQPFYQSPPTATLPTTGWSAALLLTLPLYDGGLRYGQAAERRALENEARASLENGLRQATSDVRTAFEQVKRAASSLEAAREASRLARDALELANLAYRAGASTNIEVIDAERRARDADSASAIGEDTSRQAVLDLLIASGYFPYHLK